MSYPFQKQSNKGSARAEQRRIARISTMKGFGKQSPYFYKEVSKRRAKTRRLKDGEIS